MDDTPPSIKLIVICGCSNRKSHFNDLFISVLNFQNSPPLQTCKFSDPARHRFAMFIHHFFLNKQVENVNHPSTVSAHSPLTPQIYRERSYLLQTFLQKVSGKVHSLDNILANKLGFFKILGNGKGGVDNTLSSIIHVKTCCATLPEVSAVMWGIPCSLRESSSSEEMFLVRDVILPALEFTTPDFFTTCRK